MEIFLTITAFLLPLILVGLVVAAWMARKARHRVQDLQKLEAKAFFGQLGAAITHEAMNSITGIVAFSQIACQDVEDHEKVLELLGLIEAEAKRCRDILKGFLDIARNWSKECSVRGGLSMEQIDMVGLLCSVKRLVAYQLRQHGISVSLDVPSELPLIMGNPASLKQVFLNLAFNAQQAMRDKGHLVFTACTKGSQVLVVTIADDGPGMSAEIQQRIFEPWFSTKGAENGFGIGLAVSRTIVEEHNGTLTVSSAVGQGATFTIMLPVG